MAAAKLEDLAVGGLLPNYGVRRNTPQSVDHTLFSKSDPSKPWPKDHSICSLAYRAQCPAR